MTQDDLGRTLQKIAVKEVSSFRREGGGAGPDLCRFGTEGAFWISRARLRRRSWVPQGFRILWSPPLKTPDQAI
jgi:hypothetical protein